MEADFKAKVTSSMHSLQRNAEKIRSFFQKDTLKHAAGSVRITMSCLIMPPKIILNAPTKLMREEGYGANYAYDHAAPEGFSGQDYWPEALGRQLLYRPVGRGFEKALRARLDHWAKLRKQRSDQD